MTHHKKLKTHFDNLYSPELVKQALDIWKNTDNISYLSITAIINNKFSTKINPNDLRDKLLSIQKDLNVSKPELLNNITKYIKETENQIKDVTDLAIEVEIAPQKAEESLENKVKGPQEGLTEAQKQELDLQRKLKTSVIQIINRPETIKEFGKDYNLNTQELVELIEVIKVYKTDLKTVKKLLNMGVPVDSIKDYIDYSKMTNEGNINTYIKVDLGILDEFGKSITINSKVQEEQITYRNLDFLNRLTGEEDDIVAMDTLLNLIEGALVEMGSPYQTNEALYRLEDLYEVNPFSK